MATWNELIREVQESKDSKFLDKRLKGEIAKVRDLVDGKNVVYYASGFLQKPTVAETSITREDINGFMSVIHGLDCKKDLVLIVHTPGGDIYAVESIVEYLHQKFDRITAIVPYLAMSGGSMMCLASDQIILGKQSQIGPTDPQLVSHNKNHSARAIKDAFERAKTDIEKDIKLAHFWAPILQSMGPSLIIEAEKALNYSESLVTKWLVKRMFRADNQHDAESKAKGVANHVNAHSENVYTHGQRIGIEELQQMKVNVTSLEKEQKLQEAVLTAYHLMTIIFEQTPSCKFISNQKGGMWLKNSMPAQPPILGPPVALPQQQRP